MAQGKAHIYLHPNRNGTGEKWLWCYFEPNSGLDRNRVSLLYGSLHLEMDGYNVVQKSRLDGYDIYEKIEERRQHGYTELAPLPCDDLEVVKSLIVAWKKVAIDDPPDMAWVDEELVGTGKEGAKALEGDPTLVASLSQPKPLKLKPLKGVLVGKKPVPSRYDW